MRRIDEHQVGIILAKIEDLLPEGSERYFSLTGQFSKLQKFRFGNYRVILPPRKTPSWLHSSNTGKMYFPHENLWTSGFTANHSKKQVPVFLPVGIQCKIFTAASPGFPLSREWHTHLTNPLLCHFRRSEAQTRNPKVLLQSWSSNNIWFWIWIKSGNSKSYVHRSPKGLIQRKLGS